MPIDISNNSKLRNILASIRNERNEKINFEFDGLKKQDIYDIGQNMEGLRRSFFYDLYITSGRVSEVLKSKAEDKEIKDKIYFCRLTNLKNKARFTKDTIGFMKDKLESKMIKCILSETENSVGYCYYPKAYKSRYSVNWDYKDIMVDVYLRTKKGETKERVSLFPHLLRHSRLTNLGNQYKIDPIRLTQIAGWSSPDMALKYVHFTSEGLKAYESNAQED